MGGGGVPRARAGAGAGAGRVGPGRRDRRRWARAVGERRGFNESAVALGAKRARLLWAMLARRDDYRPAA